MMAGRQYYSMRTGKNPYAAGIDLPILLRLFCDLYVHYSDQGYFQEAFGYYCVDAGEVHGTLGYDIEAQILRKLRKTNLWPIQDKCLDYREDDLFDVIEFLYDYVSKPIDGQYHSYNECGWHYNKFDRDSGQSEFRIEVNELLRDYDDGYELSTEGEVLIRGKRGLNLIFQADLPTDDTENVEARVRAAILKFRRYRATLEDRRDAVRDLVDVLEFLKPQLHNILTRGDESDLFNIANNFGIRHHNDRQKTDYDKAIWYSWMFYYYLATIHAAQRLIQRHGRLAEVEGG